MSKKTISVIGIGRVGLPLALILAEEGYKVYGIGRNEAKIELLKKKKLPFIEKGITAFKKYINVSFIPTTSYEVLSKSSVIILTLGTPIDENMNPVLDQINAALDAMIPYLRKNQLILLRSTVSPGTTVYVKDKLEMMTKFKVGKNLFLAFCPERIAEGQALRELREIPQIVGGINEASSKHAREFFESWNVPVEVTDSTSAELAKLFTNMYRYISFAISNEFMVIAESFNKNIHEIVQLVNKGYKRGGLALPGLTAGPCLFKDGFFLINENPFLDLITASWKINEAVPLFLIKKLRERVKLKNKRVAILGLAFKPEIDDIRESLSFKIRKALLREHAQVLLHDPFVKNYPAQTVFSNIKEVLKDVDVVIIATNHNQYKKEKAKILSLLNNKVYICDIWNIFGINKLLFTVNQIKTHTTRKK